MKIALVSQEYPPETGHGGIATQTFLKARGLTARGHDVTVISHSVDGDRSEEDRSGARVIRIPGPDDRLAINSEAVRWLAYSQLVAEELARLDSRVELDLIDFPEWASEGYVHLLNRAPDTTARTVVHLHGPLVMFTKAIGWPSEGYGAPSGRQPYGIHLHHGGRRRVLLERVLGRLVCRELRDRPQVHRHRPPWRGPEAVHADGRAQGGSSHRCVRRKDGSQQGGGDISGRCAVRRAIHPRSPDLVDRARARGLAGIVDGAGSEFRPSGTDPFLRISPCGRACPTSYRELTFSQRRPSTRAARASRCWKRWPAAFRWSHRTEAACRRSYGTESTGLLVPPMDTTGFAGAIEQLLLDANLREKMSDRALRTVASEADTDKCVARVEALYRKLVGERRADR